MPPTHWPSNAHGVLANVLGAHGIGIICLDHSECAIEHNTISGTTRDLSDPQRNGVAIEAHYFAQATLKHNTIVASPGGVVSYDGSTIEH